MAKRIFKSHTLRVMRINRQWFLVDPCCITRRSDPLKRSEANFLADYYQWEACQFVSGCENPRMIRKPKIDFISIFKKMLDEEMEVYEGWEANQ